jgi:hypothetical protein
MRFDNTEVAMYFADHPPPQFHVLARAGAAQIEIESLDVLSLTGRIDLRAALACSSSNQPLLRSRWMEYRRDPR